MSTPQIIRAAAEIVGQHVKCGWSICDRRRREDGTLPPLDVCPNIKPSCRDVAEGILADMDTAGLLAPEMQEEWGVESREHFGGMVTDWHLTIPFHKGRTRESAQAFIEGRKDNPGFEYRLVRRYVTAAEKEEQQ